MRKTSFALIAVLLVSVCMAEPVCVNGVCYPDEASARAAGALDSPGFSDLLAVDKTEKTEEPDSREHSDHSKPPEHPETAENQMSRRLAAGYMDVSEFTAFLSGKPSAADTLGQASVAMVFLLVLFGGLLMNLTPCVLPLVPVSLALVGRGAVRGAAYGLGMTLSYGALGLAAAFGGLAFGAIQSNPWFNVVVAIVFLVLGLATSEVFFIDFSRFRPRPKVGVVPREKRGLLGPFLLGAGTAVLAGACIAPILLATLVVTAKWYAAGRSWAVALPFVLGAGMGLPWPFITAGLSVLPKPGAWMRWVNRAFAGVLFGLAVWYGWLAWGGFSARNASTPAPDAAAESDPTRPTLVIVGAPWCKNCTAMERTTLKDPSVVAALARFNVKHVEINTFKDLASYPELVGLGIEKTGVPAYVIIARGEEADQTTTNKENAGMNFDELKEARRSVRQYAKSEISQNELEKIVADALNAPSWKNTETARYYAATTDAAKERMWKEGLPGFNAASSANAAALVAVTFVPGESGFNDGKAVDDLGNMWGAYDCGLASSYFILAAKNRGWDTLIMGLRDVAKVKEILGIPEGEILMSVIAVGKSAQKYMKMPRKPVSDVLKVK